VIQCQQDGKETLIKPRTVYPDYKFYDRNNLKKRKSHPFFGKDFRLFSSLSKGIKGIKSMRKSPLIIF
ncbi:MAG TPA: hypothetical protein DEP37_08530, partial [Algoriphagus sp.]|nr:hypothetical protein [Algoriphagus sp.]